MEISTVNNFIMFPVLKYLYVLCRVIEEPSDAMDAVGYRSQNLTNTNGADRSLVKGTNQELLLYVYYYKN